MAKTRLNQSHREALKKLAKEAVTKLVRKELGADKIESKFHELLVKAIDEQYPLSDMLVLKKYHEADICTKETRSYWDLEVNCEGQKIRADRPERLLPRKDTVSVDMNDSVAMKNAFNAYADLGEAIKSKIDERMKDYIGLIFGSRNFEDVVEAWPEAEKLRQNITGGMSAVMVITSEALRRIEKDVKELAKLEKAA